MDFTSLNFERKGVMRKKLFIGVMLGLLIASGSLYSAWAQAPIEDELVLQTPVSKFITEASLKAFAEYAKKKWGITVKVSAMHAGTPVSYGRIVEWKGKPQVDIFWGGKSALFDDLREKELLVPLQLPKAMWDEIPASIGKPVPLPIKDPKGYWVGNALEPYGLVYHPKLLKRLDVLEIKDWDDLLNPKLKGNVAQCAPTRSSSSHSTYEITLQSLGWEKGWEWLERLAAQSGIFAARSRDVPSVVAKGEFAAGFAVPSYMAFEEKLAGYNIKFVYPKNAYVTPEPIAVLAGAPHPKAAQAFIEFTLTEGGQRVFMERSLFPITPKYKVSGPPGSPAEMAVEFTGGMPSFFDIPVGNIYDDGVARKRYKDVNEEYRNRIEGRWEELKKKD